MNIIQAKARKLSPVKAADSRKRVTILGSTGSVGTQTIDLIQRDPSKYKVVALTARRNLAKLVEQARQFQPEMVVVADESKYEEVKTALNGTRINVAAGAAAIVEAAEMDSDWVMSAIVGAAGLPGTLAAVKRGAVVAFANKETLVCAGPLMMTLGRSSCRWTASITPFGRCLSLIARIPSHA